MKLRLPINYRSRLSVRETEAAIPLIKETFQRFLAANLMLERASAPLFVKQGTGINDDLSGVERKVVFPVKDDSDVRVEIVNSLAKWKRLALKRYGYKEGEGIWTDMNAIRPDEVLDNLHSLYVDQWDWERVISEQDRTLSFLLGIVDLIYDAIKKTERVVAESCSIPVSLPDKIVHVSSETLEGRYLSLDRKQRETAIAREHGAVFLSKIGWPLKDGKPHDARAPDYDDWNLNGDIIVWNQVLSCAFELSSMGIRVDHASLLKQLEAANAMDRKELEFHKILLEGQLPLSIGGGIGQSRLCMLLLGKAHIGEVQASVWPPEMVAQLQENNITLL